LLPSSAMLVDAEFNAITGQIIGAAIEAHRALGPGRFTGVAISVRCRFSAAPCESATSATSEGDLSRCAPPLPR
jgi:hypothetical protein